LTYKLPAFAVAKYLSLRCCG